MAQFLLLTTLLSIAGLIATSIAGFLAAPGHDAQHIFFALATVVLGLFSQSMTMFFFIGTGKEIKEKAGGDDIVVQRTKQFKARVFPAATYAMLVLMVTTVLTSPRLGGRWPWCKSRTRGNRGGALSSAMLPLPDSRVRPAIP